MAEIRTRFAPSPSGFLHIGGARTALFNYLFAKSQGGQFVLRIDDTDESRNFEEAIQPIFNGLTWLGLKWDEGPYYQSTRKSIYLEAVQELLSSGKAYKDEGAIRLRCVGDNKINDLVRGEVSWSVTPNDPVIVRKDGSFLYNLATVVDDYHLNISHVIRAEEHLSNTPVQLEIYRALGWQPPIFAHVPFVCAPGSKKKLSKRETYENLLPKSMRKSNPLLNPVFLEYYQDAGYLPEAVFNYLAMLGWSYDDRTEIMTPDEITSRFTIDRVVSHPASFDPNKLHHFNSEHFKRLANGQKVDALLTFTKKPYNPHIMREAILCCEDRIKVLSDFERLASFFFERPANFEGEYELPQIDWAAIVPWDAPVIEKACHDFCSTNGYEFKELVRNLRLCITGKTVGPRLFESMTVLGKEECLCRIYKK